MVALLNSTLCASLAVASLALANPVPAILQRQNGNNDTVDLSACPGYKASNVQTTSNGMTADLSLAGHCLQCLWYRFDGLDLDCGISNGPKIACQGEQATFLGVTRWQGLITPLVRSKMPATKSTRSPPPSSTARLPQPVAAPLPPSSSSNTWKNPSASL